MQPVQCHVRISGLVFLISHTGRIEHINLPARFFRAKYLLCCKIYFKSTTSIKILGQSTPMNEHLKQCIYSRKFNRIKILLTYWYFYREEKYSIFMQYTTYKTSLLFFFNTLENHLCASVHLVCEV